MKGKKKNVRFVAEYINSQNKKSIEEIINSAQERISEIDLLFKKIEELKSERSNLLDVIYTLKK